jgi:hypothetical protein
MTFPQRSFMIKLMGERVLPEPGELHFRLINDARDVLDPAKAATYDTKEASNVIQALLSLDKLVEGVPAPMAQVPADIGVYLDPADGSIYKVVKNRTNDGRHAKAWTAINGERLTLDVTVGRASGKWIYAPDGMRKITPEMKMTLDEAKRFITLYGVCVRCGRKLEAAESVERGIGPVCVTYFGGEAAFANARVAVEDQEILAAT